MEGVFIGVILGTMLGWVLCAIYDLVMDLIFAGSGTLMIDRSDPEKPVYRFDLDEPLNAIGKKKKRYILRVKHDVDLSQK